METSARKILVTGSTGQIGTELTQELRKRYGAKNVVAGGHRREPDPSIRNGPYEVFDVTDSTELRAVITKHGIDTVYHLAAVLSAVGEKDPVLAWKINLDGFRNLLEVARSERVSRIFWPSSIAVFGPDVSRVNTPQEAKLTPTTIYGVAKVAGELLANYYYLRYGIDIRSVRYPGLISSVTPPGGGTTDYAVEIFYGALKSGSYKCFLREDTILPMMYMPDALRAAIQLMEAPAANVMCRTSYNLAAVSFSAGDLAREISKRVKGFRVEYKPDYRQAIADSWPMSIDDSRARHDWGWKHEYDVQSIARDMLEKLTLKLNVQIDKD